MGHVPDLDPWQPARFLREQESWLHRGLECAEDAALLAIVLRTHEASHDRWLGLIAALGPLDERAAAAVARLYAFHGRVVGFLEQAPLGQEDPEVRSGVRDLLIQRLHDLTGRTVAALPPEDGAADEQPAITLHLA